MGRSGFHVLKNRLRSPFSEFGLTDKEAEAAKLIAFGYTQREAAEALEISRQAVVQRLMSACAKIGIRSSSDLTSKLISLLHKDADIQDEMPEKGV